MKFKRIILQNYRQYKDISVEFSGGVNLIEAGNGVGKSTLMSAIIFTLYGYTEAVNRDLIEVTLDNPLINLDTFNDTESSKVVKATVILQSQNGNEYRVIRSYNEETEEEIAKVEKRGANTSFQQTESTIEEVKSLIPKEFLPLLFFDGERVKKIEDSIDKKGDSFREEVEKILQIEKMKVAKNLINRSAKKLEAEADFDNPNLQKYSEALERTSLDLISLESSYDDAMKKKDYAELRRSELEEDLTKYEETREDAQRVKKLEENLKKYTGESHDADLKARVQLIQGYPEIIKLNIFEKIVDFINDGDDEKIIGIEQKAIDLILERGRCICNKELDDEDIFQLERLRKKLPPESFQAILSYSLDSKEDNESKFRSHIDNYCNVAYEKKEMCSDTGNELSILREKIKEISCTDGVEKDIRIISSDIKQLTEDREKCIREIGELSAQIEISKDKKRKIEEMHTKELSKVQDKKLEAESLELMQKAKARLEGAIEYQISNLKRKMQGYINEYASGLLGEGINICLDRKLRPRETRLANGSTVLSTGQRVLVSLSYLFALMKTSKEDKEFGHNEVLLESYPLIFDGVTATVDEGNSKRLIRFIQDNAEQIIIFANTKEVKFYRQHIEGSYKEFKLDKEEGSNFVRIEVENDTE